MHSILCMMTSLNWDICHVTGHLCGEFTGPRWISRIKIKWGGYLMFSLICVWINGWVSNGGAGDLWRHRPHYDVIVMVVYISIILQGSKCTFSIRGFLPMVGIHQGYLRISNISLTKSENLKCISSRLVVVCVQSSTAKCQVENDFEATHSFLHGWVTTIVLIYQYRSWLSPIWEFKREDMLFLNTVRSRQHCHHYVDF